MKNYSILEMKSFGLAAILTLICALIGTFAAGLPYLSLIGALVISLIMGMVFQVFKKPIENAKIGIGFISNKFLRLGIILLGFKLNLIDLARAGVKTILLAIVVVTGTIVVTYTIARKMKVEKELAILAAGGTGICGAAAVMGISPQIKVPEEQAEHQHENEVLAVAIVAILGTVFTLVDIGIKPLLHLTPTQFGVMTGASLHEIAHAVAAGSAGGPVALDSSIITKLSRVLMLAPASLIIGAWYQRSSAKTNSGAEKAKLPIPWFMAGFIAASVIGTFLPLGTNLLQLLVKAAYLFLGMAMAALGMSVNFKVIFQRGKNIFIAAITSSVILLVFSIIVVKLFF
ncbi:putative sulfate exporter family transporter [Lentilactobacillus sp. Marseille-Q4993]|uniref:YeiH family protein n=1 Tax=Lentilactobacillus sp. Marseille-Q4993 TaxID=3039492 RepID=UPI0024BD3975|nr:putative sulfate exporter family transporter [Lentilactobacillus sp. Marseille-Q4993]